MVSGSKRFRQSRIVQSRLTTQLKKQNKQQQKKTRGVVSWEDWLKELNF